MLIIIYFKINKYNMNNNRSQNNLNQQINNYKKNMKVIIFFILINYFERIKKKIELNEIKNKLSTIKI